MGKQDALEFYSLIFVIILVIVDFTYINVVPSKTDNIDIAVFLGIEILGIIAILLGTKAYVTGRKNKLGLYTSIIGIFLLIVNSFFLIIGLLSGMP
jgi:hypothetical protein